MILIGLQCLQIFGLVSNLNILYESDPTFGGFYNEWRVKRVNKLVSLLGMDWFKDKKVLELGCAFGNIGFYLESLGANVTFSDGRQEVLNVVLKKDPLAKVILIDEDTDWELNDKFDLIIHFVYFGIFLKSAHYLV